MAPPPPGYFAVLRGPGRRWDHAKTLREQAAWNEHAAFMDALADEGFIVLGGPLSDGERALHIVDAADEDEILDSFADDPWVQMEVLTTVSVERWDIWLGRDVLVTAARKFGS